MPSLAEMQHAFVATINDGPDALDHTLFAGSAARVILGLKAHANTVSHARLVALEETFPLTRRHLGDDAFNSLAREFVQTESARACENNNIGLHFPAFVKDTAVNELAAIEWAWLQSYHAAEAVSLTLADLAGLDEAALLAMPVAPHPSARLVDISNPLPDVLDELSGEEPAAILSIRPDAEVQLVPLDPVQRAVFEASTAENATLGNLLTIAVEQEGDAAPLEPILFLIGAGTLIKLDDV